MILKPLTTRDEKGDSITIRRVDSATTLHVALDRGYDCRCLIFDYGQRHKKEIAHAVKIAKAASCNTKL